MTYALFASVIWAAHHQFGKHVLVHRTPLVVADRTPLKLSPSQPRTWSTRVTGDGRTGRALLSAEGKKPFASVPRADSSQLAALRFDMRARIGSSSTRLAKGSIAAPEPMPGDSPAAVGLGPAALAAAAQPADASRTPPMPAFKPVAMVEAVATKAAPDRGATVAAQVAIATVPPRPVLKPIVMPAREPIAMPARELDQQLRAEEVVAAADHGLPSALRAWWSNVRILLASAAPARHARDDGSDRQATRPASNARADAGAGSEDRGASEDRGRASEDRGGAADDRGGGSGGQGRGGSNDDGTNGSNDDGTNGGNAGGTNDGNAGGGNGRNGGNDSGGGGRAGGIGGIADGPGHGDGDRGGRGGDRGSRADDRDGRHDGGRGGDHNDRGDRGDRGGRDGGGSDRGDRGGDDRGDRGGNDRGDRGGSDRGDRGGSDRGGRGDY